MLYEKLTDVEQGWSQENKCNSVCTHLCSVAKSCLTLCNLWTVAHQAPLSMGFPKQEYWSGLPFPPPGDLSDPGIESTTFALGASKVALVVKKPLASAGDIRDVGSIPGLRRFP